MSREAIRFRWMSIHQAGTTIVGYSSYFYAQVSLSKLFSLDNDSQLSEFEYLTVLFFTSNQLIDNQVQIVKFQPILRDDRRVLHSVSPGTRFPHLYFSIHYSTQRTSAYKSRNAQGNREPSTNEPNTCLHWHTLQSPENSGANKLS